MPRPPRRHHHHPPRLRRWGSPHRTPLPCHPHSHRSTCSWQVIGGGKETWCEGWRTRQEKGAERCVTSTGRLRGGGGTDHTRPRIRGASRPHTSTRATEQTRTLANTNTHMTPNPHTHTHTHTQHTHTHTHTNTHTHTAGTHMCKTTAYPTRTFPLQEPHQPWAAR
jgi:hypothetical protein